MSNFFNRNDKKTSSIAIVICVLVIFGLNAIDYLDYSLNKDQYVLTSGTIKDTYTSGTRRSRTRYGNIEVVESGTIHQLNRVKLKPSENIGDTIELAVDSTYSRGIRTCLVNSSVDYIILFIGIGYLFYNFYAKIKERESDNNYI